MIYLVAGLLGLGAIGIIIGMLKSGTKAKQENRILKQTIKRKKKSDKKKAKADEKEKTAQDNVINDNDFNNTYNRKLQNKPKRKVRT
ncbi:MAG: hypothetical protein GY804_04590 [Alphaproteobacteria bacterium]|nr:hypothetical protein [Alphaproteobacteria bacterium]